ncbi:MAG: sialidase family protein [Bacillota bacterium]
MDKNSRNYQENNSEDHLPVGEVNSEKAYLYPPQIIENPGNEYSSSTRKFQGIPSIISLSEDKLFATWYGGKTPGEDRNNYVILSAGKNNGEKWSEEKVIIDPDGEGPVRAFDPELWLDPEGKLWWFWAQGLGENKKGTYSGIWALTTENPEAEEPVWSNPRRLTDGVMMCKPIVLSSGEWLLPVSRWHRRENSAAVVVSSDQGKTWQERGACHVPEEVRSHDEHMVVEKSDGSLWMLIRTNYGIGESISQDKGYTWSKLKKSSIKHTSSRFFIRRLNSGNLLLVKHGPISKKTGRSRLTAFVSKDEGETWPYSLLLDERDGVSYPDGTQTDAGIIYLIYDYDRTGAREILLAKIGEEDILRGEIVSSFSQLKILVNKA